MSYSSKLKRRGGGASGSGGGGGGRSVQLLLALLAVIAAAAAWHYLQGRNQTLASTASLTVIAGQATVTRAQATTPALALAPGQTTTLQSGDGLECAAGSQCKLTLAGGETVELRGQARLTVLELYETPVTRALVAVLALHEGKTLSRIRHALQQDMRFEMQMNTATVRAQAPSQQAQGTIFQCDALANDHAYVLVYSGAAELAMGEQALTVQAGQASDIWLGQTLTAVDTGQASPDGPPEATPPLVDATATYTEREKTLFPPVLTPTRPGDGAATPARAVTPGADSQGASGEIYTVQTGDTLYSIARKYGVKWQDLYEANKSILPSPELVRAGQQLRIPK